MDGVGVEGNDVSVCVRHDGNVGGYLSTNVLSLDDI